MVKKWLTNGKYNENVNVKGKNIVLYLRKRTHFVFNLRLGIIEKINVK